MLIITAACSLHRLGAFVRTRSECCDPDPVAYDTLHLCETLPGSTTFSRTMKPLGSVQQQGHAPGCSSAALCRAGTCTVGTDTACDVSCEHTSVQVRAALAVCQRLPAMTSCKSQAALRSWAKTLHAIPSTLRLQRCAPSTRVRVNCQAAMCAVQRYRRAAPPASAGAHDTCVRRV